MIYALYIFLFFVIDDKNVNESCNAENLESFGSTGENAIVLLRLASSYLEALQFHDLVIVANISRPLGSN